MLEAIGDKLKTILPDQGFRNTLRDQLAYPPSIPKRYRILMAVETAILLNCFMIVGDTIKGIRQIPRPCSQFVEFDTLLPLGPNIMMDGYCRFTDNNPLTLIGQCLQGERIVGEIPVTKQNQLLGSVPITNGIPC